jgi:SAM-dependent methyltransferase
MAVSSQPQGAVDFEFAALAEARNYRAAITREFEPYLRGQVLEIGAGIGQMSAEIQKLSAVTGLTCVEPDPRFAARLASAVPGARVVNGTAADLPSAQSWDALVSVNVLEHIEHDEAELRSWARRLQPRLGHACLLVPARPELYAPIDKDFGHWRRYRKAELRQKLEQAGFTLVRLHYFNLAGYFAWAVNFRLLRRRQFDVAAVRTFDQFLFPPTHWLEERLVRPPVGQSLIAIARATAQ